MLKRLFDVLCVILSLPLMLPVGLIVAVLVAVKLGRPVLFIQTRPGRDGKPFRMYKFRTMTEEREDNGDLLLDNVCLTRFGQLDLYWRVGPARYLDR